MVETRDVQCSFAHWFRQKFNFLTVRQDFNSSTTNNFSTGFGRSAIVICPLESIIQDQVLEVQSIGVTACSLSAKTLSEVCENAP